MEQFFEVESTNWFEVSLCTCLQITATSNRGDIFGGEEADKMS